MERHENKLPIRRKRLNARIVILAFLLILCLQYLPNAATTSPTSPETAVHVTDCPYLTELIKEGKHPGVKLDADPSNCPHLQKEFPDQIKSDQPDRIDHIQLCPYIQELLRQKQARLITQSNLTKTIFAFLFPGSPRVNALLATFYISSVPNFILFFVPPDIKPSSLSTLVSFAVGGLLGDVFLHLIPQSFLGENSDDQVHFVQVEEKKNVVIGLAIFAGLTTFFVIDKMMRIVNGGEGGHSHSHSHADDQADGNAKSTATTTNDAALRQRKSKKEDADSQNHDHRKKEPSTSIKLSAYLNLFADATHNFTDGLAMAASFYTSPSIGATTTVAVFFHEIPHEIGDYAILIQSGFTRQYALLSQFGTALGAFLGTLAGIAIEEFSRGDVSGIGSHEHATSSLHGDGIWGTSANVGDLLIPFTAGGFMYISTVGVIPDLLEVSGELSKDLKQAGTEFLAMVIGVGMMAIIAWNEIG